MPPDERQSTGSGELCVRCRVLSDLFGLVLVRLSARCMDVIITACLLFPESRLTTMSSLLNLKPNIGVYTDPQHNLWIDDAVPSVSDIQSGATLAEGEVIVEMRSTGICGYVSSRKTKYGAPTLHACAVQTCTSGMLGV